MHGEASNGFLSRVTLGCLGRGAGANRRAVSRNSPGGPSAP